MRNKSSHLTTLGLLIISVGFLVPLAAHAQAPGTNALMNYVSYIETILTALFPTLVGAAILVFGYNLTKYLLAIGGNIDIGATATLKANDLNTYKKGIFNSIIALFVIFTVVGIITTLANSLGLGTLGQDITTSDPSGTAAGTAAGISTFRNIALKVSAFGSQRVIPIMVGMAFLYFFGNIVMSMAKSDNAAERVKMNKFMMWGILALFVMLTLFGIVSMITGSLFGTSAIIPQFPTSE